MQMQMMMELFGSNSTFGLILLSFAILLPIFVYLVRLKSGCNCTTCKSYVSGSWSKDFDNLSDWYTHLLQKSPTSTIHIHVLGCTITANKDNVEHMLTTKFDNYIKGKLLSTILGDLLGRGIFVVDGDDWKFQRKMASLELGSVSIRTYAFETVVGEIQTRLLPFLESVSGNCPVPLDLQDIFRRFSFDNICKFSFGLDPGCLELSLPTSEFSMAFELASQLSAMRAMSTSTLIWKLKRVLNIGSEKKLKGAIKLIYSEAQGMIRQKREKGLISTKTDLLSRFMASTEEDDTYLKDIVVNFLLAGRDTVASGLTGFFWLLSKHPEVESRILQECDAVLGSSKEVPTFTQIRDMNYLHAAIYETLRILPPIQFDSKYAREDDVLPDGTFVKKGSRVMYHPYAMGRMEYLWGSDYSEFKPQRWVNTKGEFVPENLHKYPVFQAGPRICLGKEMAIMTMKSVALSIMARFEVRMASPHFVARFSPGLTASVKGGLPVVIRRRSYEKPVAE